MSAPVAIDLFCGLGGWTEGLLAEGYRVIGVDIERHEYGDHKYPADLVLMDVRAIHGSWFKDVTLIVASPPCQGYSYRAMPWKRAKALPPPDNELFDSCFRIQREACAAAGHYIPMVVENVRGAQKWVGKAQDYFGSFYLWGDVPELPKAAKAVKVPGLDWNDRTRKGQAFNTHAEKIYGGTFGWDGSIMRKGSSKPLQRKMASAMVAKIPLTLSTHIARTYYPRTASPSRTHAPEASGAPSPDGRRCPFDTSENLGG